MFVMKTTSTIWQPDARIGFKYLFGNLVQNSFRFAIYITNVAKMMCLPLALSGLQRLITNRANTSTGITIRNLIHCYEFTSALQNTKRI
jgi:hypothetical protein